MNYKPCWKCREEKSLDSFYSYVLKSGETAHYGVCKVCKKSKSADVRAIKKPGRTAKVYKYVSKVWPIAGDTPARVAATFLDSEFIKPKAILKSDGVWFMASAKGTLPANMELIGVFNCNMPYRDLVRELAA